MTIKYVIVVLIMEDMHLGLKRTAFTPLTIVEKVLMVMGELYIYLRPDPFTPIIQVSLVVC